MNIIHNISRRKPLHVIKAQEEALIEHGGPRLSLFDLLCIGIGCTIGSGVFVLTGDVLNVAGPSAIVSWLLAGFVCMLSGFSYMELSSRVPTSGSCYSYSYHALGELAGMIGGLCLTLEYGVSGAGVARSWSNKFMHTISTVTGGESHWWYMRYDGSQDITEDDFYMDWLAGIVQAVAVVICLIGLKLGKVVINAFTVAKIALVTFMIIAGFAAWTQSTYGVEAFSSTEEFLPFGVGGMLLGASKLFFGFIGFDEVACLAGRSVNPRTTMPLAIGGTLLGATIISTLSQTALAGMIRYDQVPSPMFETAFTSVGWQWAGQIVAWGEAILLPLVVLLSFIAQPELMAAMAVDGMLPPIFAKENKSGNLFWCTLYLGIVMTAIAIFVPFSILWDMISLGVLLSFSLTNSSLIAVRYAGPEGNKKLTLLQVIFWITASSGSFLIWKGYFEHYFDDTLDNALLNPINLWVSVGLLAAAVAVLLVIMIFFRTTEEAKADRHRIFNAPLVPILPGIGSILNFLLMAQITWINLAYLALFLAVGIIMYFLYGYSHSMRVHDYDEDVEPRKSFVSRASQRHSIVLANTLASIGHHDDEEGQAGQSQIELSSVELSEKN